MRRVLQILHFACGSVQDDNTADPSMVTRNPASGLRHCVGTPPYIARCLSFFYYLAVVLHYVFFPFFGIARIGDTVRYAVGIRVGDE